METIKPITFCITTANNEKEYTGIKSAIKIYI